MPPACAITLTTPNAVCYAHDYPYVQISRESSSGRSGFSRSHPGLFSKRTKAPPLPGVLQKMVRKVFMLKSYVWRTIIPYGTAGLILAGCAAAQKPPVSSPKPKPAAARQQSKPADNKTQQQRPADGKAPQQPKPADVKSQQHYYDLGLQYYSKENYKEAKKAFQVVVDLGPRTSLGIKSQENLKKIQQILKTLEEIESK